MRGFLFWLILGLPLLGVQAQTYVSERATVTFFREAAVENLEATNSKPTCAYDPATGVIAFQVPIAEFQFKKSLMKKHFNEKYMESGKFPAASFTGLLLGFSFNTPGPQSVHAKGKLTIHGVTREVDVPGTAEMMGSYLVIRSKFTVQFIDYQVRIPELFWKSVAESVDVSIDFTLKSSGR